MESSNAAIGYGWAVILGLLQGISEFLPISSSGHLALAQHVGLGRAAPPLFDIMLHAATMLATLAFFFKTIFRYLQNERMILLYALVGTIPAAVIGIIFRSDFAALRLSPNMICLGFLVTAASLSAAEVHGVPEGRLRDLGWPGALLVGLCQALAIAPGISRSGLTISGTALSGVNREESFSFSFLLSLPVVGGAALLESSNALRDYVASGGFPPFSAGPCLAGFAAAGLSGYFALGLLQRAVIGGKLVWFAGYCCLAAAGGLAYFNLLR